MASLDESLSLHDYISTLHPSTLPRIVRICSGVYFQSSVYELSGNEVCLSTGDLVKIISFELQKVTCKVCSSATTVDLPPHFNGHFRLIPDTMPYSSIQEITRAFPQGRDPEPFSFASNVDIIVSKHPIPAFQPIFWRGLSSDGKYVKCITREEHGNVCIKIPLSLKGGFYECERGQLHTLHEILQSRSLLSRRVTCSSVSGDSLTLTPVYQVQAVMQLRPSVVNIPSDLEVDVVDITEECKDVKFVKEQMLHTILEYENTFPLVAEVLDTPEPNVVFRNDWVGQLHKGTKMIFHRRASSCKILASSTKGRTRHFVISSDYEGLFRKRPREFTTAYDLLSCLQTDKKMSIVVTKDCESHQEEFSCLYVGDRLSVNNQMNITVTVDGVPQQTNVVICTRDCDDDDEDPEEVVIPLYAEGRFVEDLTDNKRYTINDIMQRCTLPCEVKTIRKDPSMANDIFGPSATLRLEETIQEPFVVTSFLNEPSICFDLPLKWFDMSLFFTEDFPQVPKVLTCISRVEEVTDSFYYNLRKLLPSSGPPPPRPPKRQSTKIAAPPVERTQKGERKMSLPAYIEKPDSTQEGNPPPPCPRKPIGRLRSASNPNNYTPIPSKQKMPIIKDSKEDASDDEHDYEQIDDKLQSTIKKMKEAVLHY